MNRLSSLLSSIDNVQWKTQDCNSKSLLFYKFNKDDEREHQTFFERIKDVQFAHCFTNSETLQSAQVNLTHLKNEEFQKEYTQATKYFYPVDQSNFKLIGVTGTNGKTTVVDLVRQLAIQNEKGVLTIGTLGVYFNNEQVHDFSLTSPSMLDLYKTISKYQNEVDIIALEASSHALHQERLGELKFDKAAWTNFTQDHLDYHGTMEEYFNAKKKLLEYLNKTEDLYICKTQTELIKKIHKKITIVDVLSDTKNAFLTPLYNKENISLALQMLSDLYEDFVYNLEEINPAPGRFNIIPFKNSYIVIDFAHTPDALESISKELKSSFSDYSLITLFGCGGDRDRAKRPLMAKAAAKYADHIIVTSDNPRFEDPKKIIEDIVEGISGLYTVKVDRSEAIVEGINKLNKSILLIAGKGHEGYIDQNGEKTPYSDEEEVKKIIDA